ncbi:LysE family transporter [Priestia flexa]|uniref:LysE family transporter n=1 Tax=Priestia flexa TaxID=86664 RepID=UPI0010FC20A2|nr:LysE family transporter [Priestia flexa]QCS53850.1 amino acid transporter [Priestia flexa]
MTILIIHLVVLGISLAAPLGPIKVEMIKRGIAGGFWPSWLIGLGGVTGDFLFLVVIYLGAEHLFQHQFVVVFTYLLGGFFLIKLGISNLSKQHSFKQEDMTTTLAPWYKTFFVGFLIALLNPLNIVFWFGVYGSTLQEMTQTMSHSLSFLYSLFILGGIILWNLNVAFTVHFGRNLLTDKFLKNISVVAGGVLILYGVRFIIRFGKEILAFI